MNQAVRSSLLLSVICSHLLLSTKADLLPENAFSTDINHHYFKHWKAVLGRKKVDCSGHHRTGLCYGFRKSPLFAVCYNTITLIPEYTGHIVEPAAEITGGKYDWTNENGKYGKY